VSTPIGDALGDIEHFATRMITALGWGETIDDIRRWQQNPAENPYHATNDVTPPGATMSLATFEQAITNDVDKGRAMAEGLVAHFAAITEQTLPGLASLQQSKVTQVLEKYVLGPETEDFIASAVDFLAAKYGTPKTADTPAEPAAA
jgi:hypothetical protein